MRTREQDVEPFVNLSELTEIELLIMRRMREFTIGEHRSLFRGSGFDFVGLRDWQPGDRMSNIDWAQSTLTNFSPMVVREFEQRSTATVIAVADASLSTRCGIDGIPIAAAIARTIGTIGMSAVFFQDMFGLITFDAKFEQLAAIRPRIGKNQVIHCLDAYQFGEGLLPLKRADSISMSLAGFMRKTSMVPVIGRGKKLVTQTGTPPEESGSGGPRNWPQRPFDGGPAQLASLVHGMRGFSSQR